MKSIPSSPKRRTLTPEKSRLNHKSSHVYEIIGESISSTDVEKLSENFIEFRIICSIFYLESNLETQFRGKKLAIYANKVFVSQSCTIDLSGVPQVPFASDAGQNGGNGEDGRNGKDANESSFAVKGFNWRLDSPIYAEHREMYEKFGLKLTQNRACQSRVRTDDGLIGYVFVYSYIDCEYGFMLVKGEELGLPGKPGGRGGFGGQGGLAGKVSIQIDQNDHPESIKIIKNPGKNGKNGVGGLSGSKGRCDADCWIFHATTWQEPVVFGLDVPTKFKLTWAE